MKGTEKIIAHIRADAKSQADAVLAKAEEQAAQIRAEFDKQAAQVYAEKVRAGTKACQDQMDSVQRIANMEAKKSLLSVKQEIVSKSFEKARVFELDGVSVDAWDSEGWWANVRMSNTEPLVRLNLEGKTKDIMEVRRDELLAQIRA